MNGDDERRDGMNKVQTDVALILQSLETNTTLTAKLHDTILGNGGEGLVTKIAVVKSSLKRAWWFIAIIIVGLFGLGMRALV